jgi:PAS domain S-box-containing protein
VAWVAAAAVSLAALAIVLMGLEVNRKMGVLATANSDSSQWSLAQAEVELLALETAVLIAAKDPGASLSDVRRRFDVFYSRFRTVSQSQSYAGLRALPASPAAIDRIDAFLAGAVPLIDGTDAQLRAGLASIADRTEAIRADMRVISLGGVEVLSSQSDAERTSIATLLLWASALTFALFFALLLSVGLLFLANRSVGQRAQDQARLRSRLQAIVSNSLDAVLVVSREGRVLEFNGAAEEIFGYARAEAIGARMEELIIPDHLRAAHNAGMKRHNETGERRVVGKGRIKIEAKRKSGEVFPVELSIASAESTEGEVFVSFIRDISHRVAAEQALIKARDEAVAGEKAKANLLAVMSHEIRTPLNGMLGTLDLIETDRLPAKQRRYVDIIRDSGKLLLHHVNDVLQISRADAGKLDIASEPFSLPALVSELVDSQHGVAEHRGNTLGHWIGDGADGWVAGDPTRIRQVLLNLVGNAIKFTRNGTIDLAVERRGPDILFRVSDTGIGVPEADRERIFEEFVTLDASYARAAGGTGLGLAIARRLVQAMGGDIWAEADGAEGSVFCVRLPLPPVAVDQAGMRGDPAAPQATGAQPLRVLVVEDNSINREVVREMLEHEGHTVEEAHHGAEGVAMARRGTYDLVLMDISMPVLDGVEATRMIRAAELPGRGVPIVALTAHALPGEIERFREAGLDDVLIKPISRASLAATLARALLRGVPGQPAAIRADAASRDLPLLDETHIGELRALLGEERTVRQIGQFLIEADDFVAGMSRAVAEGASAGAVRASVHRVAGSAAILGATALHEHLRRIEADLAAHSDTTQVDVMALQVVASETLSALRLVQGGMVPSDQT